MVSMSNENEPLTTREMLRERRRRENAKATRSTAATFIKEFLFIAFIFAFLFIVVGGISH